MDARSIVLSRANKSVRNFEYVVGQLAAGRQPAAENIARVGYLYRTTAVYGSGKFGMADWQKVCEKFPDLARPFAAEMLTCYLIREFSLDQAEFIASRRAPGSATVLEPEIRRYFGIGNATGLGMAPYLINHPKLIGRWLHAREIALARVMQKTSPCTTSQRKLMQLVRKAAQHHREIDTGNTAQHEQNSLVARELEDAASWLDSAPLSAWRDLESQSRDRWHLETREILLSLLTELYPDRVDDLENSLTVSGDVPIDAAQSLRDLVVDIEDRYEWALTYDFDEPDSRGVFWYRSMEKMEPRLGQSGIDIGADKSMALDIAFQVSDLHRTALAALESDSQQIVGEFSIRNPQFRNIVRRIQNTRLCHYGDIQANLTDIDVLPIHLLRCKLSFFGVSKFDPKSRLWVRNTMFQGAPTRSELDRPDIDDWYFPIMPASDNSEGR